LERLSVHALALRGFDVGNALGEFLKITFIRNEIAPESRADVVVAGDNPVLDATGAHLSAHRVIVTQPA
jgi:hypothetical protein